MSNRKPIEKSKLFHSDSGLPKTESKYTFNTHTRALRSAPSARRGNFAALRHFAASRREPMAQPQARAQAERSHKPEHKLEHRRANGAATTCESWQSTMPNRKPMEKLNCFIPILGSPKQSKCKLNLHTRALGSARTARRGNFAAPRREQIAQPLVGKLQKRPMLNPKQMQHVLYSTQSLRSHQHH